jgi:dTDP-4-dehydrorhamnose reductase
MLDVPALWHQARTMARHTVLILGATGRLGRLLRNIWSSAPPADLHCIWQSRRPAVSGDLIWDPLRGMPPRPMSDRVDTVLNLLGVTSGKADGLGLNPALGLAGLVAAEALGARRCLIASSAAVYGPVDRATEDRLPDPATAYGVAKARMEAEVTARHTAGVTLLRIGNVAGADALLGQAPAASPIGLDRFADGKGPIRSYIGPADLARVLAGLTLAPDLPDMLNISAPAPVAMADLLDAAAIDWRWRPARPGAVQHATLDTTRLQGIVPLPAALADAAEIVRQWQMTRIGA